jgi:hypothetical protein
MGIDETRIFYPPMTQIFADSIRINLRSSAKSADAFLSAFNLGFIGG